MDTGIEFELREQSYFEANAYPDRNEHDLLLALSIAPRRLISFMAELDTDLPLQSCFALQSLIAQARQNNTALQLNRRQVELAEFERQLSEADFYPTVSLSARAGHRYQSTSQGLILRQEEFDLGGGVTLRIPLYQGGRHSTSLQNARAKVRQQQIRRQEGKRRLPSAWRLH